ncbi:MAG: DUF4389 domain-containing protein [Proteobacteria bacterium]|nr:DUF4389 domain-containing protein [Pseudomonadota bacterium]
MQAIEDTRPGRKDILIRGLLALLFILIFEVIRLIFQVAVLVQYVFLLVNRRANEPLRRFSNRLAAYAYRVMRHAGLGANARPFPFTDFPPEEDPLENPEFP